MGSGEVRGLGYMCAAIIDRSLPCQSLRPVLRVSICRIRSPSWGVLGFRARVGAPSSPQGSDIDLGPALN